MVHSEPQASQSPSAVIIFGNSNTHEGIVGAHRVSVESVLYKYTMIIRSVIVSS